ncbi:MAG: ABC transporter permease [Pseudomonadota bacterium]|nr:ABC transporter permease [Pseudomonadota bacterium]
MTKGNRDMLKILYIGKSHKQNKPGDWDLLLTMMSGLLLAVIVGLVLLAPLLDSLMVGEAFKIDLFNRHTDPSLTHPLGTDELGRDLLLRLLYAGRISLLVGILSALFTALIGVIIGLCAGYYGGWVDAVLMRFTDSVIALPLLPLLIVLAATDLTKLGLPQTIGASPEAAIYQIILIISLVGWTTVARLTRASVLSLREQEFVLAAKSHGASTLRVMFGHILPNSVSPILVATTLTMGNVILLESILSFLGLGIQPPIPTWGNMLTNAQDVIYETPMAAVWPGLLIFLTVISVNFLGDSLQSIFNPKNMN